MKDKITNFDELFKKIGNLNYIKCEYEPTSENPLHADSILVFLDKPCEDEDAFFLRIEEAYPEGTASVTATFGDNEVVFVDGNLDNIYNVIKAIRECEDER